MYIFFSSFTLNVTQYFVSLVTFLKRSSKVYLSLFSAVGVE